MSDYLSPAQAAEPDDFRVMLREMAQSWRDEAFGGQHVSELRSNILEECASELDAALGDAEPITADRRLSGTPEAPSGPAQAAEPAQHRNAVVPLLTDLATARARIAELETDIASASFHGLKTRIAELEAQRDALLDTKATHQIAIAQAVAVLSEKRILNPMSQTARAMAILEGTASALPVGRSELYAGRARANARAAEEEVPESPALPEGWGSEQKERIDGHCPGSSAFLTPLAERAQ